VKVERATGKVRRPRQTFLSLCHATNSEYSGKKVGLGLQTFPVARSTSIWSSLTRTSARYRKLWSLDTDVDFCTFHTDVSVLLSVFFSIFRLHSFSCWTAQMVQCAINAAIYFITELISFYCRILFCCTWNHIVIFRIECVASQWLPREFLDYETSGASDTMHSYWCILLWLMMMMMMMKATAVTPRERHTTPGARTLMSSVLCYAGLK